VRRARRLLVAGIAALAPAPAAGDLAPAITGQASGDPAIAWTRFTPTVVRYDHAGPVRLQVKVTGGVPDQVQFTPAVAGAPVTLRDDGLGADAVPGDGTWTADLAAAPLVGGLAPADAFRRFVGYADLYVGAARTVRVNLLVQVWTPEVGYVGVAAPDASTRYSTHVLNVADPALFAATPGTNDVAVTQRLLQRFGDAFDFVDIVFDRSVVANRYHYPVRNAVGGIGLAAIENGAAYGSAAKLKGVSVFPSTGFFDAGSRAHSHEIGHQWINFLAVPALAAGGAHWPVSTLASGTMGFSIAGSGAGGDYPCTLVPTAGGLDATPRTGIVAFKDLDLYLMGLLPATDVGTHYVFTSQAGANAIPCTGTLPYAQFTAVGVNDVIAAAGVRQPAYPAAQRDFTLGVVVVSDAPLPAEAMAFYDLFARRADARAPLAARDGVALSTDAPFHLQTGGRATLTARLPFAARATGVAVEYYWAALDHYFVTADPDEVAALDAGAFQGWVRTGGAFGVSAAPAAGASPVCRFYLPPPQNTHFFSASPAECAIVSATYPTFVQETANAYFIGLPDSATGACPPGDRPVFRLWNQRVDTNHRYTTDPAVRDAMVAQGWMPEGYGSAAVAMCAPP
jgi:hypothetical protein